MIYIIFLFEALEEYLQFFRLVKRGFVKKPLWYLMSRHCSPCFSPTGSWATDAIDHSASKTICKVQCNWSNTQPCWVKGSEPGAPKSPTVKTDDMVIWYLLNYRFLFNTYEYGLSKTKIASQKKECKAQVKRLCIVNNE